MSRGHSPAEDLWTAVSQLIFLLLWWKMVTQTIDLGSHAGLQNGLTSMQQIDAERLAEMIPKWTQHDEN